MPATVPQRESRAPVTSRRDDVDQLATGDGASLTEAVGRVVSSSHRLLLDRLELVRLDLEMLARDGLRATVLLATGAVLGLLGWIAAMIALVGLLAAWIDLRAAIAIVAGAHLLAGGAVALAGRRALRITAARQRDIGVPRPREH